MAHETQDIKPGDNLSSEYLVVYNLTPLMQIPAELARKTEDVLSEDNGALNTQSPNALDFQGKGAELGKGRVAHRATVYTAWQIAISFLHDFQP